MAWRSFQRGAGRKLGAQRGECVVAREALVDEANAGAGFLGAQDVGVPVDGRG